MSVDLDPQTPGNTEAPGLDGTSVEDPPESPVVIIRGGRSATVNSAGLQEVNGIPSEHPERAVQNERLAKSLQRTHELFTTLDARQQELFAIVTEDIPMNKNAGLQTVAKRLWNGKEAYTRLGFAVMWVQLALNLYVSIYSLRLAGGADISLHGKLQVADSKLTICSDRLEGLSNGCLSTTSLPSSMWRVLLLSEATLTILLIFLVVFRSMAFVCCCRCRLLDPAELAANQYFSFIAMPRITCKFSLLMCLHLASGSRLLEIFLRGDIRCLFAVCKGSLWRTKALSGKVFKQSATPELHRAATRMSGQFTRKNAVSPLRLTRSFSPSPVRVAPDATTPESKPQTLDHLRNSGSLERLSSAESSEEAKPAILHTDLRTSVLWDVLSIIFCIVLVIVSFHLLLLKLTMLYFACLFTPYFAWSITEYIIFFGFLNQLHGLSLAREVETIRVLLFKFGGENSTWTTSDIEACDAYFQYLAWQCVKQLGRAKGMMVLWTLDSDQLQQLLQGHARADEQKMVRHKEISMYQNLNDKKKLEDMRNSLVHRFSNTVTSFGDRLKPLPPEERLSACNNLQRKAIGELRLAAKVQEFIWEWEKDEIHQAEKKQKSERKSSK